ncbi:MAG: hypothetical protein Q4G42_01600 [Neisseria sp.]|nr:hypothetical protein [Neisseria sp.]
MRGDKLSVILIALLLVGCGTPAHLKSWEGQPVDNILAQWGKPTYRSSGFLSKNDSYIWKNCEPFQSFDHYVGGTYQYTTTNKICKKYEVYYDRATGKISHISAEKSIY